jgi:4-hydroxy-3-methylbut-2-enyl diphosphate reductase
MNLAASGWRVFTDGALAHGELLCEKLRAMGIVQWSGETGKFRKRDCILIRSHGVSPERSKWLKSLGCKIFDGTCPVVSRSGKLIENFAAKGGGILLFGEKNHPEMAGLAPRGGGNLIACECESDLPPPEFAGDKPVAILCQTTADGEKFSEFTAAAQRRFPGATIANTLCPEVALRRSELRQRLRGKKFDALIVVGSCRSSNGKALAQIGKAAAIETFLTESQGKLPGDFKNRVQRVLMASATSTPIEAVDAIAMAIGCTTAAA